MNINFKSFSVPGAKFIIFLFCRSALRAGIYGKHLVVCMQKRPGSLLYAVIANSLTLFMIDLIRIMMTFDIGRVSQKNLFKIHSLELLTRQKTDSFSFHRYCNSEELLPIVRIEFIEIRSNSQVFMPTHSMTKSFSHKMPIFFRSKHEFCFTKECPL